MEENKTKRAVLSVSGGMDSTSLLINLLAGGFQVKCYSFDYGQKHKIELERLRNNIKLLQSKGLPVSYAVIDIKDAFNESNSSLMKDSKEDIPEGHYESENMKSTVVENRNVIFSSIIYGKALSWANRTSSSVAISLGIHAGDHHIYADCRPESRDALDKAFSLSNENSELIYYYTPYLNVNKKEILMDVISNCKKLNIDFYEVMSNTNTCYNPNDKGESCGKCGSCTERLEAFDELNIKDPVTYSLELTNTEEEFIRRELEKEPVINKSLEKVVKKYKENENKLFFRECYNSLCEMQIEKDKRYANSALKPLDIFAKHHSYGSRIDEKLARVKNSQELRKNDVADIIGGLILLCKDRNWSDFSDLID